MDLDRALDQSRPVLVKDDTAGSLPSFDPVLLELGEAGENGDHLLFCTYRRRVQRFFEKKGASPEDAQDLTQDAFLRVFRSEVRPDNRTHLEAWLFEIARNVWANFLRTRATLKRSAKVISLNEPHPDGDAMEVADPALAAAEMDALSNVITREQLEILRSALSELPDQMRQCVHLRIKDDLKYGEIAAVMKISINTVKSHLHEAKRQLRHKLEPHFGPIDF